MAEAFPKSTFIGYDYHESSIACAHKAAVKAGLGRRVTFEVASSTDFPGSGFDLVACFDCLHDMGDPVGAARHVRGSLTPDGTWLIVEPFAEDEVEKNLNPVGRTYYAASTLVCVPASMAHGSPALGAQAGETRLREVVMGGGFTRFRRATQTPSNLILEGRPSERPILARRAEPDQRRRARKGRSALSHHKRFIRTRHERCPPLESARENRASGR